MKRKKPSFSPRVPGSLGDPPGEGAIRSFVFLVRSEEYAGQRDSETVAGALHRSSCVGHNGPLTPTLGDKLDGIVKNTQT